MSIITGTFDHKFQLSNLLTAGFDHRFRITNATGASGGARGVGAKVELVITGGGTYTIPVSSLTVTRQKVGDSPSLTWAATVFDPDGTYSPHTGSAWADRLTPDLQPTGDPNKFIKITLYADYPGDDMGGVRTYTDLILLKRDYQADPAGGYTMTLSGTDYSQVLFRDNQTMATWERAMSNDIITDILTEYGFRAGDIVLDVPDFPVVQMDFQRDRPINRIQTLLNESGAFWRVEGRRFIAWQPSTTINPQWTYKDSDNIYTLSLSEQAMTLYNMVTCSRTTKNGYVAYTQEGTADGRQSGKFSGTFSNPHLSIIENFGCTVENVDYFRNGSHVGTGFSIAGQADEVYFTITPNDPDIASKWKIEVTGVPVLYSGSGVDLDATYTYRDEESIAAYGELPAPPQESAFTATDEMAQVKAEAFMREQGRLRRTVSLEAPVNVWLELDETITVTEGVSRYSGIFNVESITTTVNPDSGSDTLEVVEYER